MSAETAETVSLVADIGGTNTRVALVRHGTVDASSIERFRNAGRAGLEDVLEAYLAARGTPDCVGACIAVAGPVRDGRATLTNLDWTINHDTLAGATGARTVAILNDLQAQGHALGQIAPENLRTVIDGPSVASDAARLVIGVGTGFNAAPVFVTAAGVFVPAAEAGHTSLPVRHEADLRLAAFLERHHGFASVEEALSGRGLAHIYDWLRVEGGTDGASVPAEVMAAFDAGGDPRAQEAARIFVRLLGCVAGDLALELLPFGGIYLIGGVTRAIAPHLGPLGFAEAFRDKGRFGTFMRHFPVHVVEDDYAALSGCAAHLAELSAIPA